MFTKLLKVLLTLVVVSTIPLLASVYAQDEDVTPEAAVTDESSQPGVVTIAGKTDISDAIDHADLILAHNFDCDGTYDQDNDIFWLSTTNPFKFKKRFTGQWYFEGLPRAAFASGQVTVKMIIPAFTQHPSHGGRETSADVSVLVTNPQNDTVFEIKNVKVGYTREGIARPTYVYIPLNYVSDDGRVIVEVAGIGQIGVHESRLAVLLEK